MCRLVRWGDVAKLKKKCGKPRISTVSGYQVIGKSDCLQFTDYRLRFTVIPKPMSKQKQKKQFYLLSLGCSKNTVDSESMAALLHKAGFSGCQ